MLGLLIKGKLLLKCAGLKVYGSKDHPDVDELHKRVTSIDDKISIATVYRTVKLFEEGWNFS